MGNDNSSSEQPAHYRARTMPRYYYGPQQPTYYPYENSYAIPPPYPYYYPTSDPYLDKPPENPTHSEKLEKPKQFDRTTQTTPSVLFRSSGTMKESPDDRATPVFLREDSDASALNEQYPHRALTDKQRLPPAATSNKTLTSSRVNKKH